MALKFKILQTIVYSTFCTQYTYDYELNIVNHTHTHFVSYQNMKIKFNSKKV